MLPIEHLTITNIHYNDLLRYYKLYLQQVFTLTVKWKTVSHSVKWYAFLCEANILECLFTFVHSKNNGSVSTATHYGLDGPGIESRWGRDFPHPSRPALGPTQPPIQWILGLSRGGKAAGAWRWPPTPIYC